MADSPLMEELDAITEGKSKLDLAEEIWKLRKQVEDARLSAALHENAAGQLAQMAVDSVSPGPSREVTPGMIEAARAFRVNLQFGNQGISGPLSPFEVKEIWERMYDAALDATGSH